MRYLVPVLACATACNQMLGIPEVHRQPCDSDALFAHASPVGGFELGAQSARLSSDELTVLFSRVTVVERSGQRIARYGDLYIAQRDHRIEEFRDAAAIDELNTDLDESSAFLSEDRQTMYFDRRDQSQRYQIFAATRPSPTARFDPPVPVTLGDATNSQLAPFLTSSALYFTSKRSDGSASLFSAVGIAALVALLQRLASLETLPHPTAYDNPVVTADDRTIYFSAPPDNASPPDIWTASRSGPEQPFGAPRAVAELNSISVDRPTWISADNCRLYFITNRTGEGFQLWMASRAGQ